MRAMPANRRKRDNPIDCVQYACNSYSRYGTNACTSHSIEARTLFGAVLADINSFSDLALKDEGAVKTLLAKLNTMNKTEGSAMARENKRLTRRLDELDKLFAALYEDKVAGNITERNYTVMSGKYELEQETITARLAETDSVLTTRKENEQNASDFLTLIKGYKGLNKLTAAVINSLIEKIAVGETYQNAEDENVQDITIYYKFVGSVSECTMPVLELERAALQPANCERCGAAYIPKSPIAKFCDVCRPIHRKESQQIRDRRRKDKRSKTHLDEPRVCQRCGSEFLPGSHNAKHCRLCK
jgi:hypothetical protein